jgi:tRNA dimethylallyltransferase
MGVLILGGTTAAGKSALAMELADRWGAGIVSADAMTVYRGMDIGTAKPSREERARVPHACIDVREPDQDFSVADFVAAFEAASTGQRHTLVVGGTPFYLSALVRPLAAMPSSDAAVRAQLEALDDPHSQLREVDPAAAQRLHPNDRMRVIRALEVHALSGQTLTDLHALGGRTEPVAAECVWMDRDGLAERVDGRLSQMVEAGYVDEVRALLTAGWGAELKPMRAFAYRHMVACVVGELALDEALRLTARDTWQFARKQRTWARGMSWEPADASAAREAAKRAFNAD